MDRENRANVSFQTLILLYKPTTLGESLFAINRKVIIEIVGI